MTVHNLAFQGQFPRRLSWRRIGLPAAAYTLDGVEYYGTIGYPEGRACSMRTASPPYRRPTPPRS